MPNSKSLTSAECANVFRAMADETRQRILIALFQRERSVTEICEALDIAQHFASRHLAVLRNAGLVIARRDAQRMIYRVEPSVARDLTSENGMIDLGCCEVRFRVQDEGEQ